MCSNPYEMNGTGWTPRGWPADSRTDVCSDTGTSCGLDDPSWLKVTEFNVISVNPSSNNKTKSISITLIALVIVCAGTLVWRWYACRAPERLNQKMIRAVAARDLIQVNRLLKEGADPNTFFRFLDEPYESQGFSPRALWIRMTGAHGSPVMRNGTTALTRAVEADSPEIVKLLIDYGADVNKRDCWGQMPLEYAKSGHQGVIVHLLLAAGAK